MNLIDLIPDNDQNWSIKNNMIYYHHYCDIAVLQKRETQYWVILDLRVTKKVLKLVKHLVKNDVKFFFSSKALNSNQDLSTQESKEEIIRNYLHALSNSQFFDNISKTGLDYVENLTRYLQETNSWEIFKQEFEEAKKKVNRKYWDYYTNKEHYNINREDIRDFVTNIERQIKLNLFL